MWEMCSGLKYVSSAVQPLMAGISSDYTPLSPRNISGKGSTDILSVGTWEVDVQKQKKTKQNTTAEHFVILHFTNSIILTCPVEVA